MKNKLFSWTCIEKNSNSAIIYNKVIFTSNLHRKKSFFWIIRVNLLKCKYSGWVLNNWVIFFLLLFGLYKTRMGLLLGILAQYSIHSIIQLILKWKVPWSEIPSTRTCALSSSSALLIFCCIFNHSAKHRYQQLLEAMPARGLIHPSWKSTFVIIFIIYCKASCGVSSR
jgi:hypothetical protein